MEFVLSEHERNNRSQMAAAPRRSTAGTKRQSLHVRRYREAGASPSTGMSERLRIA